MNMIRVSATKSFLTASVLNAVRARATAHLAAEVSRRGFSSKSSGGRLQGKVALVTGAAGGLGKGIAEKFAKEGANVVVADFNYDGAKAVVSQLPTKGLAVKVDVTSEEQVDKAVADAVSNFGKVDILVSNAGHQFISPIQDVPYAEWKKMLAVHMDGTFLFTRAALRDMYKQNTKGKIIIMGSVHSKEASVLKAPYVAAKHGLVGFARAVAKEAGPKGVSVNVVCPGFVRTPLVDAQIPQQAERLGISQEEVIKKIMLVNTVDHEFTTIDDIAEVTLFFAAHPTNALTGQTLTASHGWNMS